MVFAAFISSFLLLESREVGGGMLSQPLVISLLLIFLGYDPYYVVLTATITHLFFIYYIPSGASKYPEYPFAFFVVVFSSKEIFGLFSDNISTLVLFSMILIVIFSRLAAFYIYYKRKFLEKLTVKLFDKPSELKIRYHLITSLTYSLVSGMFLGGILLFLSDQAFKLYVQTVNYHLDIDNMLIIILSGIFFPYLLAKKKFKASSIGIIIGVIFFIIKA
ncbi:MAG: hypothetical protein KAS62_01460 [Candidatus Delongbacteria bacterium]|nr:hypothetical protein [Candidatus Delongbacteria bacterium]